MAAKARNSDGYREIEAAKERLASAKEQKSFADRSLHAAERTAKTMFEMAQQMIARAKRDTERAQTQVDSSQKEMEEAEKCLKAAEKRWRVAGTSDEEDKPNRKMRKVSVVSPEKHTSAVKDESIESVEVNGCGMPDVNGTYELSDELHDGVKKYTKQVEGEEEKTYEIFYRASLGYGRWVIGTSVGEDKGYTYLYNSTYTTPPRELSKPPKDGWYVAMDGEGVFPEPKLQWNTGPNNNKLKVEDDGAITKKWHRCHFGYYKPVDKSPATKEEGDDVRRPVQEERMPQDSPLTSDSIEHRVGTSTTSPCDWGSMDSYELRVKARELLGQFEDDGEREGKGTHEMERTS